MAADFDPCEALKQYHKVLDAQELDKVEPLFAKTAIYTSAGLGEVKGKAAILKSMRAYFKASPDHQAWDDVVLQIAPRSAICHWQLKATNKKTGEVTHRKGTERVDFDEDGLITRVSVKDES